MGSTGYRRKPGAGEEARQASELVGWAGGVPDAAKYKGDQAWTTETESPSSQASEAANHASVRMTVYDVLDYLASGMTPGEILADLPYLTAEDIQACLAYAVGRERYQIAVAA